MLTASQIANGVLVDMSSNNANPTQCNFQEAAKNGLIAVIAKATQDINYKNPYYPDYKNPVVSLGLGFAAYHFLGTSQIDQQASFFMSVASPDAKILDSETNTNQAEQQQFLTDLGYPPGEEMDYGSASTLPRGVRSLLWPASYGKNYGFGDCWQYTDELSIPGIPGKVDASKWIGSADDFNMFFFGEVPSPPQPIVEENDMIAFTPSGNGYWVCKPNDGSIYSYGDAQWLGALNYPKNNLVSGDVVTGFASHPSTAGYIMSTQKGYVYAFGTAPYKGGPTAGPVS